jgi:hypothetical protein
MAMEIFTFTAEIPELMSGSKMRDDFQFIHAMLFLTSFHYAWPKGPGIMKSLEEIAVAWK